MLLTLLAAIEALVMVSGLAAAVGRDGRSPTPTHVPGFDLLKHPTTLAALPRSERAQLRKALGDGDMRGLRAGEVRFAGGKIRAVGNPAVVCLFGGVESYGAGACVPRRTALKRGISFVSFCAEGSNDRTRITGIVPNGVTKVGLRPAAGGAFLRRASVVSNAFTMTAPPVEAILTWVGTRSGIANPLPLAQLASESECSIRSDRP
jgi:hypothetical protein